MATEQSTEARPERGGFTLVLPPGWARLEPGGDVDSQVDALVTRAFAGRGVDETARARRELGDQLRASAREAAAQGVLAVYFPFEESAGAPAPVSLAVAAMHTKGQADPMSALLAIAAQDETAQAVDLAGSVALRTTRTRPVAMPTEASGADPDAGPDAGPSGLDQNGADEGPAAASYLRREVRYLVGDPGDTRRWLSFLLVSVLPDAPEPQELADAFEELVDALMLTFAWED
jgi:hypothetical protein